MKLAEIAILLGMSQVLMWKEALYIVHKGYVPTVNGYHINIKLNITKASDV
jgi:hypothetical protein